ncbi:MAG: hypothetical protein JWN78_1571 [Bacteroidota bacterium]|nr:hypothetical protein [Bacteroidota bacterium]
MRTFPLLVFVLLVYSCQKEDESNKISSSLLSGKIKTLLIMDTVVNDTAYLFRYTYNSSHELDTIHVIEKGAPFFTARFQYYYALSRKGDTLFINKYDDRLGAPYLSEAHVINGDGYLERSVSYSSPGDPPRFYIYKRNNVHNIDSIQSNWLYLKNIIYSGNQISAYKAYWYNSPTELIYADSVKITYDASKAYKEGTRKPLSHVYLFGPEFQYLDFYNPAKQSDRLITKLEYFNPDGSLQTEEDFEYTQYSDTLVQFITGTLHQAQFTIQYYK